MQEINPLKKINLQQYQKPKTLIVVHYKGKRISVPLLGDCKNLTQMLYHHIDKFQQTVLKSDQKWEIQSEKKIVCFCSSSNSNQKTTKDGKHLSKQSNSIKKNIQKYLKYQDGDLKIDILLSMIRIQSDNSLPILDITKFYKYMEIQPYFIEYPFSNNSNNKQNPMKHKYYFYRILQKNRIKNTYLARSLQDGYFYSVRIYRTGLKMATHQAQFLSAINNQMQQKIPQYLRGQYDLANMLHSSQIIPKTQIYMVPSQQQQDEDDESGEQKQKFKHLAIIQKWDNIKGKLSDRINDKNIKITQNDILKYLKQLVWIVHQLHQEYNIIHRNLSPQSFQIDQVGDLKLVSFSSWVSCYNQHGVLEQYPRSKNSSRSDLSYESRIYQQQFQLVQDGWYNIGHYTPPQVLNKSANGYNKFVDYFTIGAVIKQIYKKIYEFQPKNENNPSQQLLQKVIQSLMSQNIRQRDQISNQLIQSIKKSKLQDTERKNKQVNLNLNQIKLGQFINIDFNQTCVENQDNDFQFNGINHQQIINFFKPNKELKLSVYQDNGSQYQAKQQKSKQKKRPSNLMKISKNQNVANSRDKSVKSMNSNKSKDKNRTKSKVLNQKGEPVQKKSKSKSHKNMISPQRNSFNNHTTMSNGNSKIHKGLLNQTIASNVQKKSKSKSCDKIKVQKSPGKKSKQKKQKILTNTLSGINKQAGIDHQKIMNRTGVHIPLPKQPYKSPNKHA